MNLTGRPKWKRIGIALLAAGSLLAVVSGSYAAYMSQDAQRGVARNRDNQVVRLSSNYLQLCNATVTDSSGQYVGKNILFNEKDKESDELEIPVNIYNHANGNANAVNENDITYTLTFTIDGATDLSKYKIQQTFPSTNTYELKDEGTVIILDKKLIGRTAAEHRYIITIPGEDLDRVKIMAVAMPSPLSATNQQKLAAVLAPGTQASVPTFQCSGMFIDKTAKNLPADYDAFNYEVSITSGRAKVSLTWDTTLVELDKYFTDKLDARAKEDSTYYLLSSGTTQKSYEITTDGNKKTITFIMNQNKGTGDELIRFYMVDEATVNERSWDDMETIITVSGDAVSETE